MNSYPLLSPLPISGLNDALRGGVPTPIVNVRDKGAKGDGKTDDTAAFQSAVDEVPLTGGTVIVPRGDYRIDVTKAIVLHSNMLFLMDPAATLQAMATDQGRYWIIKVWEAENVRVIGGRLIGDRPGHKGNAGEQGYGVNIQASTNVIVSDMFITECWGDGIWIGAIGPDGNAVPSSHVVIDRVICHSNRRQGLSIGPAENILIINSTFSNTDGTNPKAGIDIEPQRQGFTRNITISHCILTRNRGCGLEMHGNLTGISIENCLISDNFGYGSMCKEEANMQEKEPIGLTFSHNTITRNGLEGIIVGGSSNYVNISNNTLVGNGFRFPIPPGEDPDQAWWTSLQNGIDSVEDEQKSVPKELTIRASANNVNVSNNTFK